MQVKLAFTVRHATGTISHVCLPTYFKQKLQIFQVACLWPSLVKMGILSLVIWLHSNSKISKRTNWTTTPALYQGHMTEKLWSLTFLTVSVWVVSSTFVSRPNMKLSEDNIASAFLRLKFFRLALNMRVVSAHHSLNQKISSWLLDFKTTRRSDC